MQTMDVTDAFGNTGTVTVEEGVPPEYAARGATTVSQYQQMSASDLSDKQIKANQEIAAQQQDLNERQFAQQQAQYDQQQQQVREQADRQSAYDTGRAEALGQGQTAIDQAFARFTPAYFGQYTRDYMARQQDEINRQRDIATKDLGFALARQGLSRSQAGVNQEGLLRETAGRATAEQTTNAQNAAADLQNRTAAARANLQQQVGNALSIGSPIAGGTIQDVNQSLQTQRNAISGVTSTAGDAVQQLAAVPNPQTLGSIFGAIMGAGGNLLAGINAGDIRSAVNRGLRGTDPG